MTLKAPRIRNSVAANITQPAPGGADELFASIGGGLYPRTFRCATMPRARWLEREHHSTYRDPGRRWAVISASPPGAVLPAPWPSPAVPARLIRRLWGSSPPFENWIVACPGSILARESVRSYSRPVTRSLGGPGDATAAGPSTDAVAAVAIAAMTARRRPTLKR